MMVTAYVMVKVTPGQEWDVSQNIINVKGVSKAALTWGISDLFLKVDVESMEELKEIVFQEIRKIPGITDTQTIIVSEYIL
jgi:DNA-binding Lrp family transcriptional regulator